MEVEVIKIVMLGAVYSQNVNINTATQGKKKHQHYTLLSKNIITIITQIATQQQFLQSIIAMGKKKIQIVQARNI